MLKPASKKYCVFGYPIAHSLSPQLHNRAFRKLGIKARYEKVAVKPAQLAGFMQKFRATYAGANVTIPHKVTVMRFLDEVSPEAAKIGAVNCIVNRGGKLVGYNTDMHGALTALGGDKKIRGKKAVVLGAGGAARAVVHGLKKSGAKITILNRTLSHAKKLARDFKCAYGKLENLSAHFPCDILINTTSVGMWPKINEIPLPNLEKIFRAHRTQSHGTQAPIRHPIVMDIIYRPRMTRLLRDAQKAGCKIITGDKMFLAQAAASFKFWMRQKFPLSHG